MDNNYSLSDIAALTKGENGFLGGGSGTLIILFLIIMMMGGGFGSWNRQGEFGQYATAASQQEILFGQRFDALGQKMNQIGDGICSSTYALNNAIIAEGRNATNGLSALGQIVNNGFADVQRGFCETNRAIDGVNYNLATHAAAIQANDTANTQKILDAIAGNRMADMQQQINQLQLQNALGNVVRYPTSTAYCSGGNPFCGCNCNTANI